MQWLAHGQQHHIVRVLPDALQCIHVGVGMGIFLQGTNEGRKIRAVADSVCGALLHIFHPCMTGKQIPPKPGADPKLTGLPRRIVPVYRAVRSGALFHGIAQQIGIGAGDKIQQCALRLGGNHGAVVADAVDAQLRFANGCACKIQRSVFCGQLSEGTQVVVSMEMAVRQGVQQRLVAVPVGVGEG